VKAPKYFVLEEPGSRAELIAFIEKIRIAVLTNRGNVIIDFSDTKQMYPCGTLLFVAEIERLRRHRGSNSCFRCTYPKHLVVEQVLQQVGILDLLRCTARLTDISFVENVRHWRYATADNVDGAKFEPFKEGIEGKVAEPLLKEFFAGVTEAMTNCVQHAYVEDRGDGVENTPDLRRWWMFSQERNGQLSVAFCDTGIGIPRSLQDPKHWSQSLIMGLLAQLGFKGQEAELVRIAVELGKSRTGQGHRGRGLTEILDVIRNSGKGYLRIHSNHGFYRYNGGDGIEVMRDFAGSIMGTLILWNVPIDGPGAVP
jgi:hypothetical protein